MTPLIIAILAGIVSIFGFVTTRGSKVSEFRQAWINAQREDLATVAAQARRLARGDAAERDDALAAFDLAYERIRLRENPIKREWHGVITSLAVCRARLTASPPASDMDADIDKFMLAAQGLLKTEWNKVRRGELGYRVLIVAAPIFAMALAWLLWAAPPIDRIPVTPHASAPCSAPVFPAPKAPQK